MAGSGISRVRVGEETAASLSDFGGDGKSSLMALVSFSRVDKYCKLDWASVCRPERNVRAIVSFVVLFVLNPWPLFSSGKSMLTLSVFVFLISIFENNFLVNDLVCDVLQTFCL